MSATTTIETPTPTRTRSSRLRNFLEALQAVPGVLFVLAWHLTIRATCALQR